MENENITYTFEKDISIPKMIFIIPYRDRKNHLDYFQRHMKTILEDFPNEDYAIYYLHQCDRRNFNRGAMKNIGFLYVKETYPNDYKNITLIFNDVDIMPKKKNIINYETSNKNIKHFYGYNYTLGGIVSIKGGDFEKLNGFPNLWSWGYEDNALQRRARDNNMTIDRSQFYKIYDKSIIHLNDSKIRTINKGEYTKYVNKINDGIKEINNLKYEYDSKEQFVNVFNFDVPYLPNTDLDTAYNLDDGNKPFGSRPQSRMQMFIT